MKPVMKAAIKLTTRPTFSDMPRCTRSVKGRGESGRREEGGEVHTGLRLNAGCDLACADCVKVDDGLEVSLTNAFGVYVASVDPNDHVDECAGKGTDSFQSMASHVPGTGPIAPPPPLPRWLPDGP